MKKLIPVLLFFIMLISSSSCRNKTVRLLTKKWDCVQAENVIPPNTKFLSPEDSANAVLLQSLLPSINWTFKKNMRYECAVNNRVTVQGRYKLLENDKILVCTPESKSSSNLYAIITLTANELVVSSSISNSRLVLHFKPH